MLTRENAQISLKTEMTADWLEICLTDIPNKLPEVLQPAAFALLNHDEHGKALLYDRYDPEAAKIHYEKIARHLKQLVGLDSAEREAIFAVLVPQVAAIVEAGWQSLGRLPYQTGWQRKAFRASANDQAHSTKRLEWLKSIIPSLACYRTKDLPWFAAWVPYLAAYAPQQFGVLFAAAIEQGDEVGEEVFAILQATARGEQASR